MSKSPETHITHPCVNGGKRHLFVSGLCWRCSLSIKVWKEEKRIHHNKLARERKQQFNLKHA